MPSPFTTSWGITYETLPPDTESEGIGASRMRDLKFQIRTRMQADHSWNGDNNDGLHLSATLVSVAADLPVPAIIGQAGIVYTKIVNGNSELCYRDSTGNVLQMTSAGGLAGLPIAAIPSGTKMIFRQGTVPSGWTQDTTVNDQVIRAVNGNTVGVGGSWTISGVTVGGHALALAELPSWTMNTSANAVTSPGSFAVGTGGGQGVNPNTNQSLTVPSGGGGQTHTHPWSNDGSWRPAYADVIVGTKN